MSVHDRVARAFGVVLFEMLTGKACFTGETVTDVLAGVVRSEPDWKALPATFPWRLHELLQRCLTKDRKQRLHDIGDGRIALEKIAAEPDTQPLGGPTTATGGRSGRLPSARRVFSRSSQASSSLSPGCGRHAPSRSRPRRRSLVSPSARQQGSPFRRARTS
jgi:serine/threonine protein kinase